MNVYLIGYRGCGKTSVAEQLGQMLGWPWLDADAVLEARAGKSIRQIFADEGEHAFRDLESAVLADLAVRDRHVIALGGGVVLREENRRVVRPDGESGRSLVVWLQASPEALLGRIAADPTTAERRPNLTALGGVAEIRTLLAARTPLYRQWADVVLDAERQSPQELARQIAAFHSQQPPERNPA